MTRMGAKIGAGRTAEIFEWGEGQIVKLFHADTSAGAVDYEYTISRTVQDAAINVPFVGEQVEVDGRRGIIYERIDGESMLRRFMAKPWQVSQLATQFAETHALMHTRTATTLPTVHERVTRNINLAPDLTDANRAEILRRLNALPVGETICHGDYHPDNVLLAPRGPIVIDWTNAMHGDPLADVARTALTFSVSPLPPDANALMRIATRLFRNLFYTIYINRYRQLRPFDYAALAQWMLPTAAARLNERIPGEETALHHIITTALAE